MSEGEKSYEVPEAIYTCKERERDYQELKVITKPATYRANHSVHRRTVWVCKQPNLFSAGKLISAPYLGAIAIKNKKKDINGKMK